MQIIRYILFPFSIIYGGITALRNFLYNKNIMKSASFETPIISIGNLSTGGTGKSPHTEYLIRLLKDDNNVATLSRGYGRSRSGFHLVEKDSTIKDCGDEPLQFKSKFPEIPIAVHADRVNGIIELFKAHEDTNVVLLDDAFQHRALKPSFSVLLTQYSDPFYKDFVLPTGNLREFRAGKKRADVIIVTKCPLNLSSEEMSIIKTKISPTISQSVYFTKFTYGAVKSLWTENEYPQHSELPSFVLVTGIAKTTPLEKELNAKHEKLNHVKYSDHHRFTENDIEKISNIFDTLADGSIVLTTEKDAQRFKLLESAKKLPIYYIEIKVEFIEHQEQFDAQIIEHVKHH